MKKSVLTLAAVAAFGIAAKAQTFGFQKSDVILEGSIGASTTDNKAAETKTSTIGLSPRIGYFVSDKAAVGVSFNYNQTKATNYSGTTDSYQKTNSVGAGVFGRYYFWELGQRFKTYAQAEIDYSNSGSENSSGNVTIKSDKVNTFGIDAGVGANFFITKNVAIGYQFANVIGYSTSKVDKSGAKATNSFFANVNSFGNFFSTGSFSLTFKL